MRIALMAGAWLALAACGPNKTPEATAAPAAAANATGGNPVAVIEPLYQPYLKEGQNPPDWRVAVPWTVETKALVEKEAAASAKTGDVGAIDGDVIIAAQDWKISNLKISLKSPAADGKAVVEAVFDNLDAHTLVDWDMVIEGGAWKVEDVHEPEVDLIKLLKESLQEARKQK